MSVLIDTHVWIWWVTGQAELSATCRGKLDRLAKKGRAPFLSAISLWEAQMLFQKGRLDLEIDFDLWLASASDPEVVRVLPLDVSVIMAVNSLPGRFHGDPADRLIVATAIAHSLPMMTDDKAIRRSRLVEISSS